MLLLVTLFMFQILPDSELWHKPQMVTHYTVADGLPMNFINRIIQDQDGYIYFSTFDGLVRFDGYEFEVFNSGNTPGMGSNRLLSMHVSGSNELWILTDTGSVIRKKGPDFQTFSEENSGFRGRARYLAETEDGTIWLAADGGLFVFDEAMAGFVRARGQQAESRSYMVAPACGAAVLVVNENGLYIQYEEEARKLLPTGKLPGQNQVGNNLTCIQGQAWVSSVSGVVMVNIHDPDINFSFIPRKPGFAVWNVHETSENEVIINSTHGYYTFDLSKGAITGKEIEFSSPLYRSTMIFEDAEEHPVRILPDRVIINGKTVLSANDIQASWLDREGGIWIGTFSEGLYHIRQSYIRNIGPLDIAGFENLYPIIEHPDGSIWAGSLGNGVYRLGNEDVQNWSTQNSSIGANFIRYLHFDETGNDLFAGGWSDGLWRFSGNDWIKEERFSELFPAKTTVEAMHHTQNGELLIGTAGDMVSKRNGVYARFKPGQVNARKFRGVRVIRESEDGTLFFGTNGNGLTVLSRKGAMQYTTSNSGIGSNLIRDIFIQSADTLWLATENLGLTRVVFSRGYDRPEMTRITTANGLIHNSLHRIIADSYGFIWLSSNGGIMRIGIDDLSAAADGRIPRLPVMGFTEQDGMLNREANGGVQKAGLLSSAGLVYFPNQKGLTIIDPADFIPNEDTFTPVPAIKYLAHSGNLRVHPANGAIQLERGVRNIRIKLSAPNFNAPERLQFLYRMDGIVDEWEDATQTREAVLTNLPAGEHTFRFTAGTQTSAAGTMLRISVPPYFHENIWFYLMLLLGLSGLVAAFVRYRTFAVEKRKRELQALVDRQTKDLRESAEQKSRFFSGITHELKTPLSLILNPVDDLLSGEFARKSGELREKLILVKRNGIRLNQLTDQILDVTRLNADAVRMTHYQVDLPKLTRQITGQFHSGLKQRFVRLEIEDSAIEEPVYLDPNAYERIIINLVSNAIRFSPENGVVTIRFSSDAETISVEVSDEGPGIGKSEQESVFEYLYQVNSAQAAEGTGIGLYLVRGLCRHMKGDVSLVSEPGKGAAFTVTFRRGFSHFKETDTVVHRPFLPVNSPSAVEHPPAQQHTFSKKGPSILVVEDNIDYRQYLTEILSEHFNVIAAANGADALKNLEKQKIDLVLSDVMMPEMNGLEFISKLRMEKEYHHLPVIFLSARNTETDAQTGLGTGADVYLSKPVSNSMLLTQIAAILRRESLLRMGKKEAENKPADDLEQKVRALILRHLANPELNVNLIADALYISRTKLYRDWKDVMEKSLNDYIKQLRMEEAGILLKEKKFSVKEAARATGYLQSGYFSTSFKKHFGVSPSEFSSADEVKV